MCGKLASKRVADVSEYPFLRTSDSGDVQWLRCGGRGLLFSVWSSALVWTRKFSKERLGGWLGVYSLSEGGTRAALGTFWQVSSLGRSQLLR